MRNFVLFTNFILIMSIIHIYSFVTTLTDSFTPNLSGPSPTSNLHYYNLALFLVMSLPELFLPPLRPLASLLSLFYLYAYSSATHGHLLAPFFFVASSFTFGCSLSYTLSYLRLTFLGLTKKELRCIELEGDPEKLSRGPGLVRGLRNMLRFYFQNASDPG